MQRNANSLFVLFYYNQVLGLPGTLAGAALFIALLVDGFTDPLIGTWSDHCRSKLGRRHPFMFAAALPVGLTFIGLFAPPSGLGEVGLFLWLTAFAVLTRFALTLYNVPHLALGTEITEDPEERTRLILLRQLFSYLGTTFAIVVGFGWFFSDARGGRLLAENYPTFAIALGTTMTVAILVAAVGTRSEIRHVNTAPPRQRGFLAQLVRDVRESARNKPFVWLAAGTTALFVSAGGAQDAEPLSPGVFLGPPQRTDGGRSACDADRTLRRHRRAPYRPVPHQQAVHAAARHGGRRSVPGPARSAPPGRPLSCERHVRAGVGADRDGSHPGRILGLRAGRLLRDDDRRHRPARARHGRAPRRRPLRGHHLRRQGVGRGRPDRRRHRPGRDRLAARGRRHGERRAGRHHRPTWESSTVPC